MICSTEMGKTAALNIMLAVLNSNMGPECLICLLSMLAGCVNSGVSQWAWPGDTGGVAPEGSIRGRSSENAGGACDSSSHRARRSSGS